MKNKLLILILVLFLILSYLFYRYMNKNIEAMSYRQDLYISDSNIHGKGLFTNSLLKSNEFVFVGIYKCNSSQLFNSSISHYGHFINHQKEPNCKIKLENGDYNVYTIKPINKNEELTIDYDLNPDFLNKSEQKWNE